MTARLTPADRACRDEAMAAMYAAGNSLAQVGAAYGLTSESVRRILKRRGAAVRNQLAAVKANWQDPAFRERNAAATKANWQDPAFRERNAAATKAALEIQWTPEMDAALVEARAAGHGITICAEIIGVSPAVVEKRIAALGLPSRPAKQVAA